MQYLVRVAWVIPSFEIYLLRKLVEPFFYISEQETIVIIRPEENMQVSSGGAPAYFEAAASAAQAEEISHLNLQIARIYQLS